MALFLKGISQKDVAITSGLSASAVSRRINGEVPVTVDELDALATAAGHSLQITLAPEVQS